MRTGAGLALICVGAILAFAVTANTSVFDIHIAGWVLMFVGVIGMLIPRRYGWMGRRMLVRRTRTWPPGQPGTRVEEVPVPPYVAQNPGTSRARLGLPPTPSLLHTKAGTTPVDAEAAQARRTARPDETEVVEDLYEPPQSPLEP